MKWGLFFLAVSLLAPAAADQSAQGLVDCMQANLPQAAAVKDVELLATDRLGSAHDLKGKIYFGHVSGPNQDRRLSVSFQVVAPADLSGAAYMVRTADTVSAEDTMFVFLPTLHHMRRITGASANGSLLGTNISYGDFKQIETAFSESAATLEKPQDIDRRPVQVLAFRPRSDSGSPYALIRSWVDQKTCVPLITAFYEGLTERKRLAGSAAALRQIGTHWYLTEAVMRDLKDGSSTVIRVNDVVEGASLPDSYFQPYSFYQPH